MPRNITITFGDGTTHVYQNTPDNVTPDAVQARAEKEFSKKVSGINGGSKPTTRPETAPDPTGTFGQNTAAGFGKFAVDTATTDRGYQMTKNTAGDISTENHRHFLCA